MDEKEQIVVELGIEMLKTTPDDYMYIKLVLMAHSAGNPALIHFLREFFRLIELHRPRLIEMRGDTEKRLLGQTSPDMGVNDLHAVTAKKNTR